jgi:hypothetical protein
MGPRGSGSNPEDSWGLLVFTPQRPPMTARRRGSGGRRGSGLLPAPLRTARPLLLRDARVARSSGRLKRDGGRSSGGGLRREGPQGTLVAAPFRATAFPRYGRRHLRRLNLLLAPLQDLVIAGSGTTGGRHDRAESGKAKLEVREEVGDALGGWHTRYLKKSDEGITLDVSITNFRIECHCGSCLSGSWEESMGHVAAGVRQPTSHDDSRSYGGGDFEVK